MSSFYSKEKYAACFYSNKIPLSVVWSMKHSWHPVYNNYVSTYKCTWKIQLPFFKPMQLKFLSYTIPWFYEKYVKSIILYFSLRLIIIDVDTYVILNVTRNLIGPNSIYAELLEETERSRFWKLPTIHQIIISCIATTKLWQIKKKGINEWILLA